MSDTLSRPITTSFLPSADLSNKSITSSNRGKDWALVSFQFKFNIMFIETMINSMLSFNFLKKTRIKCCKLTGTHTCPPFQEVVLLFFNSTLQGQQSCDEVCFFLVLCVKCQDLGSYVWISQAWSLLQGLELNFYGMKSKLL